MQSWISRTKDYDQQRPCRSLVCLHHRSVPSRQLHPVLCLDTMVPPAATSAEGNSTGQETGPWSSPKSGGNLITSAVALCNREPSKPKQSQNKRCLEIVKPDNLNIMHRPTYQCIPSITSLQLFHQMGPGLELCGKKSISMT